MNQSNRKKTSFLRSSAWKEHFEFFLVANEADGKAEKVKTAMLLSCNGDRGREIFDTFTFENVEASQNLTVVLKAFDDHCTPKKNTTILRQVSDLQTDGRPFFYEFCD